MPGHRESTANRVFSACSLEEISETWEQVFNRISTRVESPARKNIAAFDDRITNSKRLIEMTDRITSYKGRSWPTI